MWNGDWSNIYQYELLGLDLICQGMPSVRLQPNIFENIQDLINSFFQFIPLFILLVIPNIHWSFCFPHLFSFPFIYMDHWSHMDSFTRKCIPSILFVLFNLFLIHKLFSTFNLHCIVRKMLSKFLFSYSFVLLPSRL